MMDSEHVKGAADKAKGAIKDAAGETALRQGVGAAHEAVGDLKDAVGKTP